mmetsp:Transcript_35596/g.101381  ORF Transcript_35596/g.101381 Transcript_35596/m.101381 type:complete len:368 (-) Transcript_35596:556-1659(-)
MVVAPDVPLGHQAREQPQRLQAAGRAVGTALLVAADQELVPTLVGVEHHAEDTALGLDFPHLPKTGAEDEADVVLPGQRQLCDVGAPLGVHADLAVLLLQQPSEVVPATLTLHGVAGDKGHGTDELQYGAAGRLELRPGGPLPATGVGHVLGVHGEPVDVETLRGGLPVGHLPRVMPLGLALHRGHDHQLRAFSSPDGSEDGEFLTLLLASLGQEEGESPERLFDEAEGLTAVAGDVANALERDLQDGGVVTPLDVDVDRALELLQQPLQVLLGMLPLLLRPGDEDDRGEVLDNATRGSRDLLPRLAMGADRIGQLLLRQLQRRGAPIAVQVRLVVEGRAALPPTVRVVSGHLRLHDAHHRELGATP